MEVAYCAISNAKSDLVAALLPSLGIEPINIDLSQVADVTKPLILNCLNARMKGLAGTKLPPDVRIVCDVDSAASFSRHGAATGLSNSYGRLRAALTAETSANHPPEQGNSWVKKFTFGVSRKTKKPA
jgi:hypothetical protein